MKQLKLKQGVKDFLSIALLYLIIVIGVILINTRLEKINTIKNTGQEIIEPVSN